MRRSNHYSDAQRAAKLHWMKFSYVKIRGTLRPTIPLVLRRGDFSTSTDALVDSGADASLFHADYAADLGIETIEDGEEFPVFGISGAPLRAYRHEVTLEVGGNRFHNFPITFSRDLSPDSFNILGQSDFFALFPIKFTYTKQEVAFSSGPPGE